MKFDYVPDHLWKEIAIDFAKRWLSHDGLWFQEVEKKYGMEKAVEIDIEAWKKQTVLEARRIMSLLHIEPGGGLEALERCLQFRMYAFINEQKTIFLNNNTLEFYMETCRVQRARELKGMEHFPCKEVGIVEYSYFAKEIDPRIKTQVIGCPPDKVGPGWHCGWRFSID